MAKNVKRILFVINIAASKASVDELIEIQLLDMEKLIKKGIKLKIHF